MSALRLPVTVLAVVAATLALSGCQKSADTQSVATAAVPALQLDESQLLQPIRFQLADIDASQSACVDFSAHANDQWLAANPIPPDQSSWGAVALLRDRSLQVQRQLAEQVAAVPNQSGVRKIVADLWATGMDEKRLNEQGVAPLAAHFAAIGALTDAASIADYLRKLAARGENQLFDFEADADFKDSTMSIAYATQSGINLPDRNYYFDKDKQAIREAYEKHIAKVLQLSGIPTATALSQARDVMAFETRLARVSKSTEQLSRDYELYYNPLSLADADKLTPNFSWTAFFAAQGVAASKAFSLAMPAFHQEVSKMLIDVPVARWQSYLRYQLLDEASPYLSEAFTTERFEFYNKFLNGQQEQRARWKRVLAVTEDVAGEAMGQLYVEVAFPPAARERMEQLVSNLTAAFKGRIEKLGWMSDATRAKALAKNAAFTAKIGYPSKWRDWSGLTTSRDSYFGNVMAAKSFNHRWEMGKIGKPVDQAEWSTTPQTVNAFYNPLKNAITFPAAFLQPPMFDRQADDAYNYGAVGTVIGHEMTHGFDDQGSRFGPTGNFEQWWTPADEKRFKALTGKLIQQFNGYSVGSGMQVNGNLTLGENIADLGGLYVAYDALLQATAGKADSKVDGLTRDQRFFYGWATGWRTNRRPEQLKVILESDPHAPESIRVNAVPTNHPAFAAAFGCKDGDPMVNSGDQRVVIW